MDERQKGRGKRILYQILWVAESTHDGPDILLKQKQEKRPLFYPREESSTHSFNVSPESPLGLQTQAPLRMAQVAPCLLRMEGPAWVQV